MDVLATLSRFLDGLLQLLDRALHEAIALRVVGRASDVLDVPLLRELGE